jgi:hypothetical protein
MKQKHHFPRTLPRTIFWSGWPKNGLKLEKRGEVASSTAAKVVGSWEVPAVATAVLLGRSGANKLLLSPQLVVLASSRVGPHFDAHFDAVTSHPPPLQQMLVAGFDFKNQK